MTRRPLRITHAPRLLLGMAIALALPAAAPAAAPEPAVPAITATAENTLWWGDFAALDKLNTEYRRPGQLEPDGTLRLDLFRIGLAQVLNKNIRNPEPYLKDLSALTLKWAKEHPRSAFAHALHARALVAHGESYRGTSVARDVTPGAWEVYYRYLGQAAAYLKDHADVALTDSYAHLVLLKIGRGQGWTHEQMAAVADDGYKRNPEDPSLHEAMVDYLLPKWGGSPKALDSYIMHVTEQTRPQHGWGRYAYLYSLAAEGQFGNALFEDSHADWDKMKRGYEDILAKYPGNAKERNRYAYLACMARDKASLLRLLAEIGAEVRTESWGRNPERVLETCRAWATQV